MNNIENKRKYIEDTIADILVNDGPDKHIDGFEEIADFVISLIEGKDKEWIDNYFTGPKKMRLKDMYADLLNYHNK